jgi:hypothetical protein
MGRREGNPSDKSNKRTHMIKLQNAWTALNEVVGAFIAPNHFLAVG